MTDYQENVENDTPRLHPEPAKPKAKRGRPKGSVKKHSDAKESYTAKKGKNLPGKAQEKVPRGRQRNAERFETPVPPIGVCDDIQDTSIVGDKRPEDAAIAQPIEATQVKQQQRKPEKSGVTGHESWKTGFIDRFRRK